VAGTAGFVLVHGERCVEKFQLPERLNLVHGIEIGILKLKSLSFNPIDLSSDTLKLSRGSRWQRVVCGRFGSRLAGFAHICS
jgi:hypothetical protein